MSGSSPGACFADFGHQVTCVDKDKNRVAALNRGEIPIFEPGLAELVEANMRQGRLEFAGEISSIGNAESRLHRRRYAVAAPATATPTSVSSTTRCASSRRICRPPRSSSPNRRCRSAPATRSRVFFAKSVPTPKSRSSPIRNSCAEGAAIQDFKHPDRIVGRHRRCAFARRARGNLPAALPQRAARSSMSAGAPPS